MQRSLVVKLVRAGFVTGGVLPWLRALADRELPTSLKRGIDQAFSTLCHHLPDRTLVVRGEAMCVCSRCAGLYAGVASAALFCWGAGRGGRFKLALHVGLALMIVDIVTQDVGFHAPCHSVRLATGAWVGAALTGWMFREAEAQRFSATLSRADRSASRKATLAKPA
jgi:uncharacterized membrane protein